MKYSIPLQTILIFKQTHSVIMRQEIHVTGTIFWNYYRNFRDRRELCYTRIFRPFSIDPFLIELNILKKLLQEVVLSMIVF